MAINEKLKFSWGHIIAFVAMIVISYFSFLGLTYLTDGNFIFTGIGVVIVDVIIAAAFIGAQVLKGTDHKFKKRVVIERTLVAVAPLVLIAMMYPACHFWKVYGHRTQIEDKFYSSVTSIKDMFSNYEAYAEERCNSYSQTVNRGTGTQVNKQDRILALSLQLKDENYTNLRDEAIGWIEKAKGATVWNVFLIANIKTIKKAIVTWNEQLVSFSEKRMSNEPETVSNFDSDSASLNQIISNLDGIKNEYSIKGAPTLNAIIMLLLCYLFLMFPYVIQQRNTKSQYHLFYNENSKGGKSLMMDDEPKKHKVAYSTEDNDVFTIEERPVAEKKYNRESYEREPKIVRPAKESPKKKAVKEESDDDFESFTM